MAPFLEIEHVVDAQQGFSRPLVEGRLTVPNIVNIGVKSRQGNKVIIEATVIRATSIDKDPVTVILKIIHQEPDVSKRIEEISCTCPAGACKLHCCKHAMAVVIYLERRDESEVETLTCTDTQQVWGKVKNAAMSRFDPAQLDSFCHFPKTASVYRRKINDITEEMKEEFKQIFLKDQPLSEAAVFWNSSRVKESTQTVPVPRVNKCSTLHTQFFKKHILASPHLYVQRIKQLSDSLLSKCSSSEIEFYQNNVKLTDKEALFTFVDSNGQDNDVWEGARFGRITGSISYELFTYFVNKNPDWDNKLACAFGSSFSGDNSTKFGTFCEPFARAKYATEENRKGVGKIEMLEVGIVINPLVPWLGFSADSVIFQNGQVYKLWENKTAMMGKEVSAMDICKQVAYIDKKTGKLKRLHKYYGQIQLGLALLNLPACDFTIYCSGPVNQKNPTPIYDSIHVETIVLDQTFCDKYLERLCHVYFEKVLPWLTACYSCTQEEERNL